MSSDGPEPLASSTAPRALSSKHDVNPAAQSILRNTSAGLRTVRAGRPLSRKLFMTVPLWAALASLVVACVQPLQHALDAHMQPVKGAVTSAGPGNCSIPLTLIVHLAQKERDYILANGKDHDDIFDTPTFQ
ncbi:hypothetical protein C8R47DRAFT_1326210 [Mycena vitilis]|nr:hypothetical protein C8R47DRAFT_1326210 [Mycena vitilis]